ncbi:MAG: MFS transporter [Rhodospirillales bacterium]
MAPFLTAIGASIASSGMGRSMRHREYRLFSITHFISAVGFWLQRVGIGWLTWDLTHSGAWLGIIAFAEAVPMFLLTPIAGSVADRVDRLKMFRLLNIVNTMAAAVLAALTIFGLINIYWLTAIAVTTGALSAMQLPARMTMAPGLVPRDDVPAAIGFNAILFQLSAFIGPAAAGLIIASLGVGYLFVANVFSYVVFIVGLYMITLPYGGERSKRETGIFADMVDGIRYVSGHAGIAPLILLVFGAALFVRPYMDMLPGFADAIFDRGPEGLATLVAASGVGGMAAGIWLAVHGKTQHMTSMVLGSVLVGAIALLLFASTNLYWLAAFWVAVIAGTSTLVSVGAQMLIQTSVDDHMRGRVMSLYGLTWRGIPAIGALMMGGLSSWAGLQAPLIGGGLFCIGLWAVIMPRKRRLAEFFEDGGNDGDAGRA